MKKESKLIDGVKFPGHWNDLACLLYLYREAPLLQKGGCLINDEPVNFTGGDRFYYAKKIGQGLFPNLFEWHDWSDSVVQASTESELLCVTGCGASSKSTSIGLDAFLFWLCDPLNTAVINASTTIEAAKKRIWKSISAFYHAFVRLTGVRDYTIGISPRPYISPYRSDDRTKRDEAHGMYVVGLQKKAEVEQEMEYIKGFHPRRIMVIADEFDSLREHGKGLFQVFIDNLSSGAVEAKFRGLGNDPSLFNELGELMQRVKGKPLTLADKEWTSIHGVKCLRLDAWDSPNIRDNNKWTGLIRQQDIDRITAWKGENSPSVWIQLHGLHPPEGAENTVLSEASFVRFHAAEKVVWKSGFTSYAALDPAFGGDDCVLRRFDYGLDTDNRPKILFHEPKILQIQADKAATPAEYQIAEQVITFCKANSIRPENFILDASGTGRGVASVLQREWHPSINICEFGGLPSALPVSDENPTPAKDEYDRKVTELCFSFREFVEADLVRGLDTETMREFCARHFEIKNRKTAVESKTDMKGRGLSSPDRADCTVLATELLRTRGINASVQTKVKMAAGKTFESYLKKADVDADDTRLYLPEPELEETYFQ